MGGNDTLGVWATDGSVLHTLNGHQRTVFGALELHDGRLLSWEWDGTFRLWAADGTALHTLNGHEDGVQDVLELLMDDSDRGEMTAPCACGGAMAVLSTRSTGTRVE